eukprot:5256746-Amphidinium_carterae.1
MGLGQRVSPVKKLVKTALFSNTISSEPFEGKPERLAVESQHNRISCFDVSRYIDENGLARAAKRLSTSLARLRAVEAPGLQGNVSMKDHINDDS